MYGTAPVTQEEPSVANPRSSHKSIVFSPVWKVAQITAPATHEEPPAANLLSPPVKGSPNKSII
jgi:hypothetical protein